MKAKENEGKKLFIIFILLVVTYSIIIGSVSAAPADPGHGAPSIGPGTFEGGHYIFPNNLSVTQNFSVDTNTLYVDSVLHRIGIGTTSPIHKLEVNGSTMISGTLSSEAAYDSVDDGLVVNMPFYEGTGSTAADKHKYGNNGVISGTSWVAGKLGNALSFSGSGDSSPSSDYVTVSDTTGSSLDITSALTMEVWVKTTQNADAYIITKDNGWLTNQPYAMLLWSDAIHVVIDDVDYSKANSNFYDGSWHHIVATWNGTVITYYFDGTSLGTSDASTTLTPNNYNLSIGARSNDNAYGFNGTLDEVRLYDRALTADEVWSRYESGLGTLHPYVDASGNVGIGTTTPQNTLNVIGTGNFTTDLYVADQQICREDGTNCPAGAGSVSPWTNDTSKIYPVNGSLNVTVDTDTLYVDVSNDRIGIGTTGPTARLDIRLSGTNTGNVITLGNVDWGRLGVLGFGVNPSRVYLSQSMGSEQLVITDVGNVGIGTTSPQNELNVNGTVNATDFICISAGCINAVELNSDVAGLGLNTTSGVLAVNILSPGGGVVVSGDAVVLNQSCSDNEILKWDNGASQWLCADDTGGGGGWTVSGTYVYNDTSAVTVGIGNNTPVTKLAISSPSDQLGIIDSDGSQEWRLSANSDMLYIEDENTGAIPFKIEVGADTDTLIIDDAGNVGIGTTGPTAPLHIDASTTAEALFINSSSTSNVYITINSTSSIREFEIGVTGSAHGWGSDKFFIRDETAGQGRLVIDSSGNVGIGTSSPSERLNVNGSLRVDNSTGSSVFFVNDTSGRVGIGTTNPRGILEIYDEYRGTLGWGGEYADWWWDSTDNYGFWFTNRVNNTGAHTIFRFDSDATDVENMELKGTGDVLIYHNLGVGVVDSKQSDAVLLIEGTDYKSAFYPVYREFEDIFLNPGKLGGHTYINHGNLILSENTDPGTAKFAIGASPSDEYLMKIGSTPAATGDILTINSTGYIGIGDMGPDARLEVLDSSGPQLMLTNTDNVDYANFTVDSDGNLTISSSSGNVIIKLG